MSSSRSIEDFVGETPWWLAIFWAFNVQARFMLAKASACTASIYLLTLNI